MDASEFVKKVTKINLWKDRKQFKGDCLLDEYEANTLYDWLIKNYDITPKL